MDYGDGAFFFIDREFVTSHAQRAGVSAGARDARGDDGAFVRRADDVEANHPPSRGRWMDFGGDEG